MSTPRYVILADGKLALHDAKTAACLIRYKPQEVVAVLDRVHAGRTVQEVLGFGGSIPVLASLDDALSSAPDRLLIGIAPPGGGLPDAWRRTLVRALESGLDLYSGLHTLLADDPELAAVAQTSGARIVDLRAVPDGLSTPTGARDALTVPVVLAVGSDCNIGKMTAMWEIWRQAQERERSYRFAATGQTGVLLAGRGMAIDRVISDFVAGAAERITVEAGEGGELVLVEGQGSLLHPFYSGVTLGLLHGSRPDGMILCHAVGRETVRHCENKRIPGLARLVEIYEEAASWVSPARVIGISLATYAVDEDAAWQALEGARTRTGLPAEDPVRFPDGSLLRACEELRRSLG